MIEASLSRGHQRTPNLEIPTTGHLMSAFLKSMREVAERTGTKRSASAKPKSLSALKPHAASLTSRRHSAQIKMAAAASELSQPLDMIAGAAWSLKEGCPEEDRKFWVDCILMHVLEAQNSIEDFKDEVCDEVGLLEVHLEEVNLSDVVRQAVRDFVPLAPDHTLRFYGDDAWILGDAFRLQRLVFHLLSNAIKHCEAGREIKVDVWRRGNYVCLFVQDQGRGPITNQNECMFLPFRRLVSDHDATTDEGWGISNVKRIADAHGATVKVQGVAGQGTIFEVSFKALDRIQQHHLI